jgi:hypothetical protein
MAIRLSCSSCNSSFVLPAFPAEGRSACPRCGDVFPVRGYSEESDSGAVNTNGQTGAGLLLQEQRALDPPRRVVGRWSIQRTLAVALAMGLIGLIAGFGVYYLKGGIRPKPSPEPEPPPLVAAVQATQLVGLGYLPADATIVFSLQLGPVLAYAERTKQDPRDLQRDLLIAAGLPRTAYDPVAHLGLSPRQIDHIACGASGVDLRFTLALVLRRPLDDEEGFLKRLKAKRANGPKERYRVDVSGVPFDLTLARISPTVWVFGVDAKKDLAAVDKGGYGPGGKQFAATLTEAITGRVPPEAAAWLATAEGRWDDKPLVQFFLGQFAGKTEWLKGLAKGRAVVAALSLDESPRLRLFLTVADERTAEGIRVYFAKWAESNEQVRHGGAGELAFLDVSIDPVKTFAVLRQLLSDAAKP